MTRALKAIFAAIVLVLSFAAPVAAGPFEDAAKHDKDALAAHDRGDYATALRLWRPLAEQGFASVQHNLALMYENGQGVPKDYAEAVKWYRKAAEQGHARAQDNLGRMYAYGWGVPQDYVRAFIWVSLSAAQSNQVAIKNRDRAAQRMTPAQIAEAQKLAREWKPTKPVAAQQRSAAEVAAEFVVGNCYRSIDDISRVKSMARVLKWSPMPEGRANAMKPVDASGYQSWHVIHDGQHFFIGVNSGSIDGKAVEVCSVVANHPPDVLVPIILKGLKVRRLLNRDATGFQITETYDLEHLTQKSATLTVIRGVDNDPPVSFAFMGFR